MRLDKYQEACVAISFLPPGLKFALETQEQLVARLTASEKNEEQQRMLVEASYKLAALRNICYGDRQVVTNPAIAAENLEGSGTVTPEKNAEKLVERLEQEAEWYKDQFEAGGGLECLKKVVETAERAAAAAEDESTISNLKKAALYNALGHYLEDLSDNNDDDMKDGYIIERAIEAGETAVSLVECDGDMDYHEERSHFAKDVEHWEERRLGSQRARKMYR